jgi:hypothetical protein
MAIWRNDGDRWELATPAAFSLEKTLHDLVEGAPHVLPLAGDPRIIVLGREVPCGSGSADLLAVESTGRLVILEVKLASNSEARRAVVAQVLAYAAALRGLTPRELDSVLAGRLPQGVEQVADAVAAADQEGTFSRADFDQALGESLTAGRFRLVLVLDSAPPDLVRLVGYLESITDTGLLVDLVTVTQYDIAGSQILVPQRIEPEVFVEPSFRTATNSASPKPVTTEGLTGFIASIETSPVEHRAMLQQLAGWAQGLVDKQLVTLYSTKGTSGRTTLIPRLRGYDAGLVTVVNESNGPCLWLWRTVFERLVPGLIADIEAQVGKSIGAGTVVTGIESTLLDLLTQAHEKAVG